jgi:hypothetical protein
MENKIKEKMKKEGNIDNEFVINKLIDAENDNLGDDFLGMNIKQNTVSRLFIVEEASMIDGHTMYNFNTLYNYLYRGHRRNISEQNFYFETIIRNISAMRNYSVSTYPLKIKTNDDDKHEILKGN